MPETPPLYSARPAVTLDGVASPELTEGLIAALVEETTEGLFRCEATFGNWGNADGSVGYLYADRRVLDFGKSLTLRMGAGDKAADVFTGRITGIEGHFPADRAPEITVLAEDRFQDLRMSRRTRTFEDVTTTSVIQGIASDYGLRPDVDVPGPQHPMIAQVNQSDLAFLRDVADADGAEVWVDGDVLHAAARPRRTGGPITITFGRELRELSVLADVAGQRTSVAVSGWDVGAKEAIDGEAGAAAIGPELDGTTSGVAILEASFGARKERVVHTVPMTGAEATAVAEAALRRSARRFVTGRAVTEGDGRIRVGATVELLGVGETFNGRYRVTRVRHEFDPARGYLAYVEVERPGMGGG